MRTSQNTPHPNLSKYESARSRIGTLCPLPQRYHNPVSLPVLVCPFERAELPINAPFCRLVSLGVPRCLRANLISQQSPAPQEDRVCLVAQEGEIEDLRPVMATRYTPDQHLFGFSVSLSRQLSPAETLLLADNLSLGV
jgi:hypothetical protein